MLSLLSILLVLGFSAFVLKSNSFAMTIRNWNGPVDSDYNYGHPMMEQYNRGRVNNNRNGGYGGCNSRNGNAQYDDYDTDKVLSLDTLQENVKEYVSYYGNNLEIEDIFVYSNSEYYFSIVEKETGKGAMELLVDPITGYVFPEYGPNMMWNTKYGMHSKGYGMMGRYNNSTIKSEEVIDKKQALERANDYMLTYSDANYNVEDGGHEFYGYYTFHVTETNKTVGMLSVNYYTGEIWYHNWHGNLNEVISAHHE